MNINKLDFLEKKIDIPCNYIWKDFEFIENR